MIQQFHSWVYIQRKEKTRIQKDIHAPNVHGNIINTSQEMARLPRGPVVRNLPASVGNTALIPGPGRFHVLRGN